MLMEPVHKREYDVFLSHSSRDKKTAADELYRWLAEIARIRVWYDSANIVGGDDLERVIQQGIIRSRAIMILLSQASQASEWVGKELEIARQHREQYPDFRIIPILLDDVAITGFLEDLLYIDMPGGELTLQVCDQILRALYHTDYGLEYGDTQDIYVSRGWHEDEVAAGDDICRTFVDARMRLIGDSKTQKQFSRDDRIRDMLDSCTGFLGIVPYRPDARYAESHYTSSFILEEIALAQERELPHIIIYDHRLQLPDQYTRHAELAIGVPMAPTGLADGADTVTQAAQRLSVKRRPVAARPHFVFFATDFAEEHAERNRIIRKTVQRITAMHCVMGQDIHVVDVSLQAAIIERIIDSYVVIADISNNNLNTLIEAGIARGADVAVHMVAAGRPHFPPFMFADRQVSYYLNDVELIGRVHKILYPYRRRVINFEMETKKRPAF